MTRKPPDQGVAGISKVLLALCVLASISTPANAQPQRLSRNIQVPSVAASRKSTWVETHQPEIPHLSAADSSNLPDNIGQKLDKSKSRTNNAPNQRITTSSSSSPSSSSQDAGAVILHAPAERLNRDAVRAPAFPVAAQSDRPSSRLPARSLQDWKVEDIVLLATVDGQLHARNRNTGGAIWALEADKPMVETTYGPQVNSADDTNGTGTLLNDFLWIVEPSEDGALYLYNPSGGLGLKNLHLTVKQLAEIAPHQSDYPPVHYTAEKKSTLYTVDIATGGILKVITPTNSIVNGPGVCQVGGLDALDDDKCGAIGTLTLTRVEYTIGIFRQDSFTGEHQVCTIRYSEWGPNNRDKDLHAQYSNFKDDRYIHSGFNGQIYAIDHKNRRDPNPNPERKPAFWNKLSSPVARVFDVARPLESTSLDTPLVLLPQPLDPVLPKGDNRVFVNCTERGSWFALSEMIYPLVTGGALPALGDQDWSLSDVELRDALVGVHSLNLDQTFPPEMPAIGAPPENPTIEPPNDQTVADPRLPSSESLGFGYTQIVLALLVIVLSGYGFKYWSPTNLFNKRSKVSGDIIDWTPAPADAQFKNDNSLVSPPEVEDDQVPSKTVKFEDVPPPTLQKEISNDDIAPDTSKELNGDTPKPSKKKTHRGSRGGRREAERKALQAEKRAVKPSPLSANEVDEVADGVDNVSLKPDQVYQTTTDNQKTHAGLLNLEITSNILGHGSGGTLVFEGKFEGRDVAVKRMLGQYSELASQEVSLLEQSEDHPNVIRYFCRRQDDNFLYIALELCQASLWELYRDGRREEVLEKYRVVAEEINNQPTRVLQQLTEGLKHLHSFRIVHRDIKPQNMLIAYPKKHTPSTFPRLVISDFGLCKTLPEGASTLIGATVNAGTIGWKAPELISQPRESSGTGVSNQSTGKDSANGDMAAMQGIKRSTDIFSLGCVFFYVLTHGLHPFDDEEGWMGVRERNIKENRCNLEGISIHGPDTVDMIRWMLDPIPEARPTAAEVLAHPFFWDAEDRLEFLSAASDRFDFEARDGASIAELESYAEEIIGAGPSTLSLSSASATSRYNTSTANGHNRSSSSHSETSSSMNIPIPGEPNFLAALDKKFIDTLGKQRKYQGHKVVDLLRALRNKHHHWDDMPEDVKQRVGAVPEGYLRYWEQRFPKLTVTIWRVLKNLGISEERRFWRWYGGRTV